MERLGLETRPARLGSRYNPLNLEVAVTWPPSGHKIKALKRAPAQEHSFRIVGVVEGHKLRVDLWYASEGSPLPAALWDDRSKRALVEAVAQAIEHHLGFPAHISIDTLDYTE